MPTQLVKLALIDEAPYINSTAGSGGAPLETDLDIEVFSIFQEGAQDASRQVFSIEPNVVTLEGGVELIESKTYAIDVAGLFNQATRTKIKNWSKNRTPLYVSGYGLDGHVLYGYGTITATVGTGTNMSFRFRMQSDAKGGYDASTSLHSSGLSYSPNGKAYWKWEAHPSGGTNRPLWFNGIYVAGVDQGADSPNGTNVSTDPDLTTVSGSRSFSAGEWNVQPSGGNNWDWFWMYFPFPNVTLKLTWQVNTFVAPTAGTNKFALRGYEDLYGYSDYTVNDQENVTSTGTFTATITTTQGMTAIAGYLGVLDGGRLTVAEPRLTIDEVKPFIEFNT